MGFIDRLFGKKTTSSGATPSGEPVSLAASLVQQDTKLAPKKCDNCGTTFLSSEAQVSILSARAPSLRLDIGGYCPTCGKHLCQQHLEFGRALATHLPDPEAIRNASYGVLCKRCGTRVRHDRNAEPTSHVTIVTLDAKDLEPKRAKPAAQVAAPSGKFSLHKIVLALTVPKDSELAPVPTMICLRCFTPHPHPVPAPVFGLAAFKKMGYEVGADDFEVDIGGDCPSCGVICGQHAVLKEITVEGARCLALHCADHDLQLR